MTNQNPAAPNPQPIDLDADTLAKVNAHADRSIDRLFADIDELLSGDLTEDLHSSAHANERQQQLPAGYSDDRSAYQPPIYLSSPAGAEPQQYLLGAAPSQQQQRIPFWLKALLGIGLTSIALGSLLLWLINTRKIELPTADTSWLPFQSKSQVSAEDAKFADYLRKSLAKIDTTAPQSTTATNLPNPASNNILTRTPQPTPVAFNPNRKIVAPIAPGSANALPAAAISLFETHPNRRTASAIFEINGRSQTVEIGEKIGTSKWSLLTVAKGEVLLKKTGGEIRSIHLGQKF
jgi:hypothetical protein